MFPSLIGLVREAGIDVWDDVSPIEERALGVQRVLTPPAVYYRIKEIGKLFDEMKDLALEASQTGSRSQVPRAVGIPSRYAPRLPLVPQPETQGEQQQGQDPRYEAPHEEYPELPPRPSCIPDNHDIPLPDIEEDEEYPSKVKEVEFGTAVQGRMTRCQRVLTVRRAGTVPDRYNSPLPDIEEKDELLKPEEVEFGTALLGRVTRCQRVLDVRRAGPVPEEYRTWGLASRASFSNGESSSSDEASDEEVFSDDATEEYETEEIPLYRCRSQEHTYSDSSSDFDFDANPLWLHDSTPEQYHLHHIRRALFLPPTTPRRHIEGWLIRNPSVPYHLLTATVPSGPGARRLASGAAAERANADLEWHLRRVEWEIFRVGRVHRRRRVGSVGRKSLVRGVGGEGLGVDGGWVRGQPGPSKLRDCEVAE